MTNVDIRREGSCATVIPSGDVVASLVPELRAAMRNLVRDGVRDLNFDMTAAEMIDSTGIGLLLSAYNSLAQAGGRFAVTEAASDIEELLRTMRVHQHFSVSGRKSPQ